MKFDLTFTLIASLFALSVVTSKEVKEVTRDMQQQEIGTEICYCAPNSYEFTLDFSLTCPPVNITLGDAVAATTCMVSPFGEPGVIDLVPVSVNSIDILELNQNLQVIVQENTKGNFLDGDTFSYVSYAAMPGMIVNPEDIPRAIQLNIVGENNNGEEIINVYLITFTNSCGAYPVLSEGQFAGWTRFSDLGAPNPDLCPAVPTSPTLPPTSPPITLPPITSPTIPQSTLEPTIGMSMSMSMSMDIKFKSLTLQNFEDFFPANEIIEKREISHEFGQKKSYGNYDGIFSRNYRGDNSKIQRLGPLEDKMKLTKSTKKTKDDTSSKSYKYHKSHKSIKSASGTNKKQSKESKKELTKLKKSDKHTKKSVKSEKDNKTNKKSVVKKDSDSNQLGARRLRI